MNYKYPKYESSCGDNFTLYSIPDHREMSRQ